MDFNKERFVNFAKYDLAINRKFYRNLFLVTISGALGIALLGFIIRWWLWQTIVDDYKSEGMVESFIPSSQTMFAWDSHGTSGFLFAFCVIMLIIFSGCWAHNLRTRQGRIIELTLPASNIEKFLWHIGLMVGGGTLLAALSMLLADGLNAVLCLCTIPKGVEIQSLSTQIWDIITLHAVEESITIKYICISITLGSLLLQIGFYIYGNALKYKYNIILTYIAEQIISTVLFIAFLIGVTLISHNVDTTPIPDGEGGEWIVELMLYAFAAVEVLLAYMFVWLSYRRYVKAQLITSLNK